MAVTQTDFTEADQSHGFHCQCGFVSTGWPTKTVRDARKREHKDEHATGEPMSEIVDFRDQHGVDL